MKKIFFKVMCLVMCLVLSISFLTSFTGCSSKSSEKVTKTLTLWSIWASDSDQGKKPLSDTIKKFEEKNPNIKIKISTYPNQAYKTKISTAMRANEIPDLFFSWGALWAQDHIRKGKVLPLDQYVNDIEKKWVPGTKDNFVGQDNKLYAIPMTRMAGILYCNHNLFTKNDVKLPDTYDELLTAIAKFKNKGITPIAMSGAEDWTIAMLQNIIYLRISGLDKTQKFLRKPETLNRQVLANSAAKVQELIKKEAFGKKEMFLSLKDKEAQQYFLSGKAAMRYIGTWELGNINSTTSKLKNNIVYKNFPLFDVKRGSNTFQGGATDTFMISKKTNYKKEAVKALKFITEEMSAKSIKYGFGLPAWQKELDESSPPSVKAVLNLLDKSEGSSPNWDICLDGLIKSNYLKYIKQISENSLTPHEFAQKMAEVINQQIKK